jgi:hypothetical protein
MIYLFRANYFLTIAISFDVSRSSIITMPSTLAVSTYWSHKR